MRPTKYFLLALSVLILLACNAVTGLIATSDAPDCCCDSHAKSEFNNNSSANSSSCVFYTDGASCISRADGF